MPNYAQLAATAKRLIEASGRTVMFRRLGSQIDNTAKPWRGSENIRTAADLEVAAKGVFVDPVSASQMGLGINTESDDIQNLDAVCLVAADSVAFDLESFDEVLDASTIFHIEHREVLKPGDKKLLYIFLLKTTGQTPTIVFPASLLTGLVAWYRLEGPAGATWPDAHTGLRHLTPSPAPLIKSGKYLFGASFTGTQQLIRANDGAFNLVAPFEVAVWARTNSLGVSATLLGKQDIASLDGWDIFYDGTTNAYALDLYESGGANSERCLSLVPISPGQMNLIQTWLDAGQAAHIRINGAGQVDDSGLDPTPTTNSFKIGCASDGSSPFNGVIDEVAIWSRNLTEDERAAVYNGGYGITYPT